ncbi:MAG TPA: hypothetical protein VLV78_18790 [Thermoanaerobaculia bacterium]|nr:hypothetical protein [Thermoanaerobaculia bacterium]
MRVRMLIAAAAVFAAVSVSGQTPRVGGAMPVPLPLFPPNNWWNTDISHAPTVPDSTFYYPLMGTSTRPLHPDFGGDAGGGFLYGFPVIIVDGSQAKQTVTFIPGGAGDESDGVDHNNMDTPFPFYPIPGEAITNYGWVEDGPPGNVDDRDNSDRHILVVDATNNTLYELYFVWYTGTHWEAYSGAFFDMNTNDRRPEGWTSADAAGLAILPGLVRYDEVYGPNEITHAFRVTLSQTNGHVFPASHTAGSTSDALPMGARLRLKNTTNISGYPAEMQKIFQAMMKYGLIVADNGSNMYVSGTYDTRWDNDILNPAFGGLHTSDFEVISFGWKPSISLVISIPTTLGNGDAATATVTAYDANDNLATGYTGTIHFTSTGSASLPADYTFVPGDNGTHTFPAGFTLSTAGGQTIAATDVADATITGSRNVIVGPPTPTGLVATAESTTSVGLSWNLSSGATQYEIFRNNASLTTTASTNFTDTPVSAGTTYVYKVRAIDASSRPSPFSAPEAATTILFTDDPVAATATSIKAVHVTELRQAINAMRVAAGLGTFTFTDATLAGTPVRALHIQEMRTALDPARAALGLGAISYTDSSIVAGTTAIKAAHVQQLRNGVK